MYCNYQILFIILMGTCTSQYFVLQYVKNLLCLEKFDTTLQMIWDKYYMNSCQNYDLWKQNSALRIGNRLQEEQQRLVLLFYLWNMMWVLMLCFCLPRIWAIPVLLILLIYGSIVMICSYLVYYLSYPQLRIRPDTYLPNFYI